MKTVVKRIGKHLYDVFLFT